MNSYTITITRFANPETPDTFTVNCEGPGELRLLALAEMRDTSIRRLTAEQKVGAHSMIMEDFTRFADGEVNFPGDGVKITLQQVEDKPWRYDAELWKSVHNVHSPYIAEISPMQYAHLSKKGRKDYDAKRNDEWSASSASADDWREAVIVAMDAGRVTWRDEDVSRDAKWLMIGVVNKRDAEAAKQAIADREKGLKINGPADVKQGDRVYAKFYRSWAKVTRVNQKTLGVRFESGTDMRLPYGTIYTENIHQLD